MQLSERWLRTWVDPHLDSQELANLLTMSGLEVEEKKDVAPFFDQVVIAEIVAIRKHENADRLNICIVDIGEKEPLQIVCGAPNVAVGIKVPCARVGAVLPGDFQIKQATIRGVHSSGMLCSEKELGLSEASAGLMVLPTAAPVGESIRTYLQLDDCLLTIKLTPNRADCLSVRGVAREVAALTEMPWHPVDIKPISATIGDTRGVTLAAPQACPHYLGRILKGINPAAPTPLWIKQRLERSGIRPISAIVDITNYVMLELGQPLHAFNLDKLEGNITVRFSKANEVITLLNGKTLVLDTDMLVIADDIKPIALAGIMGGSETAVETDCNHIFLESAFFSPDVIASLARHIGFTSESAYRFERGVDFENTRSALERATQLIVDICGGNPGPVVEKTASLPVRQSVTLRTRRIEKVLGVPFSTDQVLTLLHRLQFSHVLGNDGTLTVTPPSFRFDISIEEDLIEEVARLSGYDNLPTRPAKTRLALLPQEVSSRNPATLKHILVSREYQEVVNYAFVDETWEAANTAPIRVMNPIAAQMSVMRSSMWGGLVNNLRYNINRHQERIRFFEVGRVFLGTNLEDQPEKIAGLIWGSRFSEQWGTPKEWVDFFDIKADVEALLAPRVAQYRRGIGHAALHPGRSAEIWLDDKRVGLLGEMHPKHVQSYDLGTAPMLFELDVAMLKEIKKIQIQPISKYPLVRRDLALIVDENLPVAVLLNAFSEIGNPIVTRISLFDVYRGEGIPDQKKSLTFSVLMQDMQRTLTEKEIDAIMLELICVAQKQGAVLRTIVVGSSE